MKEINNHIVYFEELDRSSETIEIGVFSNKRKALAFQKEYMKQKIKGISFLITKPKY